MSYKKRQPRLDLGFNLGISIVLFLILIISNFAGNSLSGSSFSLFNQNDRDLKNYCCNYPPIPGSEGTGMTSDGIPTPEEPAFLVLPCIIKPDNTEKRSNDSKYCNQGNRIHKVIKNKKYCLATSSSKVSALLAHQFTLVGAKPSGTS